MDAGYGNDTGLRTEITALGLRYAAGIGPNTSVWPPGIEPLRPQRGRGSGRPPKLLRRDDEHQPVSVKALALGLPAQAWQTITWREGSADWLTSRFARQRVRPAHRDTKLSEPRAEEWLLIEWPQGETEPTSIGLPPCPRMSPLISWSTSQSCAGRSSGDDQELKQELGFGDYEGRGWRGFHHHAYTLYRRLRLLDRRTRRPSPLRTDFRHALLGIWPSRGLPTQRRRRSDPNDTFPTRSQPSADGSSSASPGPSRDALAGTPICKRPTISDSSTQ